MCSMVITNHIPRSWKGSNVVIWLSVGEVLVSFQAFITRLASQVLLG